MWHEKVKPRLLQYFQGLSLKMETLKENIKEFFKLDIQPLINQLDTSEEVKEKIRTKHNYLKSINLTQMLENL